MYFSTQGVASYQVTPSLKSNGACIDNNHSHFILVDNGTVGKYGGEIGWRAKLQNCFAAQKIPRSKYVIDVLDCCNVQEAMERKKEQNRLTVASFYFVGKLFVLVTFCMEILNPRVISLLGKVGSFE